MKILVVSNMYPSSSAPSYGVFVKNFCTQLEELEINYSLAVMKKHRGKLGKIVGYVGFYLRSFLCCLFGSYDIVYVHYASHSSLGVLLARKLRRFRIFTNCHGSDVIPQNAEQEKMQKNTRAILSLSEKIIVPSDYFRRVVSEKYAIDSDAVRVCASGGVDMRVFRPCPRKEENAPFTMSFVSRITQGKGWDVLLDACAALPVQGYRLLIVGDGPQKAEMLRRIDELGLAERVQLYGLLPQEALREIYGGSDVFLFPTELSESLGLVAVEAMACGIPVIASDFAAPADYVSDGVNGYKFPKGDARALAQRVMQLRGLSEEDRTILKDGALQTAARYSRAAVTQTLKTILQE